MRKFKNAKELISEYIDQSKPLQKYRLCEELKGYFSKKGLIKSINIKNNILFIKASSFVAYTELKHDSTIKSLKNIANTFKNLKNLGQEWELKEIKLYYENTVFKKPQEENEKIEEKSFFIERSLGNFTNKLSNTLLYNLFENIRKAILKKCKK